MNCKKCFHNSHDYLIRKKIAKNIQNELNNKFILLSGKSGSGKSFIAKYIANSKKNKNKTLFYYECVQNTTEKETKEQIVDYESFLSNTLLKYFTEKETYKKQEADSEESYIMTVDLSIENKEHLLREKLENPREEYFFILDDIEKLKSDDRDRISNFLVKNIELSKHSVILITNKSLGYYSNFPKDKFHEVSIGDINDSEFSKICNKYINTLNFKPRMKIKIIRFLIGRNEFYYFLRNKSNRDLCLMKEILMDLKQQCWEEYKITGILRKYKSIEKNYSIERGKILRKLLDNLNLPEKKLLQILSFCENPVSYEDLFENDLNERKIKFSSELIEKGFDKKQFTILIKKCDEVFFCGYIINDDNCKYSLDKNLRDLLEIQRNTQIYEDLYKDIITSWIEYYKDFSKIYEQKIDSYLNGSDNQSKEEKESESCLNQFDKEFDNITRVLNYCYDKRRWRDYFEISEHIWYYCELKNKDINEYHYKRYLVAQHLTCINATFESALHYCNIACKKGVHLTYQVQKTFEQLEHDERNVSERLKNKYKYTLALKDYANKDFSAANIKFSECENCLPVLIENEKNSEEKILLQKDLISSVRWHAICLFDDVKEQISDNKIDDDNKEIQLLGQKLYDFVTKMDDALNNYEEINYDRVKSSILMYKISILIFLYTEVYILKSNEDVRWRNLNRNTISYAYNILTNKYYKNVILRDVGLKNRYRDIKEVIKPYFPSEVQMTDNTIHDEIQKKILPILEETENLFYEAIKQTNNGIPGKVSLTAMPDLGLANNVIRMKGGFFTGMFLEWESAVPIVPIDTTINSCGIVIYLLKKEMSIVDFKNIVTNNVYEKINKIKYNWNFERGNHFITLGRFEDGRYCILMHASADEYKKDIKDKALYPDSDVWYSNDIKTIRSPSNRNRYLRYLSGETAKRFIDIALQLENINHKRMKEIADLLFGQYIEKEILFVPHYGMPTKTSIAIGCSWNTTKSVLLTAPGRNVYIIKQKTDSINNGEKWLTPHGLGVSADITDISYKKNLLINDLKIIDTNDVKKIRNRSIRYKDLSNEKFKGCINEVLSKCNAEIDSIIHPLATLSESGFQSFDNKEL